MQVDHLVDMDHEEGVTALMYAAAGGHGQICEMLLNGGADVNARHKQGGSALLEAATNGSTQVLDMLLKAGADPFVTDDDGVTSLMSAASQGHLEATQLLVSKGLGVNDVAHSGGTAIMFAAGGGHNSTVLYLLESGADVNVIVKATPEYKEQVAEALEQGDEDVEPHVDGVTAVMVAAQGGFTECVRMLVEAKAEVDIVDEDNMTPLLYAVKGNHVDTAKLLVQSGANPNDVYIDDKKKPHNLLMDSVVLNNTEFALLLLEKGANVDYQDDDGVTVITQASYQGQTRIVESLLKKHAHR